MKNLIDRQVERQIEKLNNENNPSNLNSSIKTNKILINRSKSNQITNKSTSINYLKNQMIDLKH